MQYMQNKDADIKLALEEFKENKDLYHLTSRLDILEILILMMKKLEKYDALKICLFLAIENDSLTPFDSKSYC